MNPLEDEMRKFLGLKEISSVPPDPPGFSVEGYVVLRDDQPVVLYDTGDGIMSTFSLKEVLVNFAGHFVSVNIKVV